MRTPDDDLASEGPPRVYALRAPRSRRALYMLGALLFAVRVVARLRRAIAALRRIAWRSLFWRRCELCGARPRSSRLFCAACLDNGMR